MRIFLFLFTLFHSLHSMEDTSQEKSLVQKHFRPDFMNILVRTSGDMKTAMNYNHYVKEFLNPSLCLEEKKPLISEDMMIRNEIIISAMVGALLDIRNVARVSRDAYNTNPGFYGMVQNMMTAKIKPVIQLAMYMLDSGLDWCKEIQHSTGSCKTDYTLNYKQTNKKELDCVAKMIQDKVTLTQSMIEHTYLQHELDNINALEYVYRKHYGTMYRNSQLFIPLPTGTQWHTKENYPTATVEDLA